MKFFHHFSVSCKFCANIYFEFCKLRCIPMGCGRFLGFVLPNAHPDGMPLRMPNPVGKSKISYAECMAFR